MITKHTSSINKQALLIFIVYLGLFEGYFCFASEQSNSNILFEKIIKKYQSYSSYEDQGVYVYSSYKGEVLQYKDTIKFHTYFSAPNKLRMEWLTKKPNLIPEYHILWSNDNVIKYFMWGEKTRKYDDINTALSAATGISGGVTYRIPKLLIHDMAMPPLLGYSNISIQKIINDNNKKLIVFELIRNNGSVEKMWVEHGTLTIKKIEWRHKAGEYDFHEIIEYIDIKTNKKIDSDVFDVDEKDIRSELDKLYKSPSVSHN